MGWKNSKQSGATWNNAETTPNKSNKAKAPPFCVTNDTERNSLAFDNI